MADPAAGPTPGSTTAPGVSVVIPVHNGATWLERVVGAVEAQAYAGPLEILAVEDGSHDGSRELLERFAATRRLQLLDGERRGAAAAINLGIRAAAYPLIAQIDQDVVITPGWMAELTAALDHPTVGAAQGHYVAAPGADIWSRVMALDLRQRYSTLGDWTDHVCTGNSVYRRAALMDVGLFDESLGYGYDNDISYRLAQAGYRLAFRREAESAHYWREGLVQYARQQYGFGYGRIDLVAKHRHRLGGDDVSGGLMMLHAPMMALCLGICVLLPILATIGLPVRGLAPVAAALIGALSLERLIAGSRAARRWREPAGYWFVPAHLVRDVAWTAAIVVWGVRRAAGWQPRPADSMAPRAPAGRL